MRRISRSAAAAGVALVLSLGLAGPARADGEAGVVIQIGDTVETFCIGFTGDGITGDQLLKAAGQTFDAYGGGSGLAICSIGDVGCSDAGSFTSCFCQCQGGDCTYWAFFTRGYGKNWVYSSLAFNLLKAKDGDLHGWKWGKGSLQSAPVPQDVTFDQVCGHAPRGGVAPTVAVATAPAPTVAAGATSAPAPSATASMIPTLADPVTTPEAPTASVSPLVTIAGGTSGAVSPSPEATRPASSTPGAGEGDSNSPLLAFGVVAGGLVAAIAGAAVWRARRG